MCSWATGLACLDLTPMTSAGKKRRRIRRLSPSSTEVWESEVVSSDSRAVIEVLANLQAINSRLIIPCDSGVRYSQQKALCSFHRIGLCNH